MDELLNEFLQETDDLLEVLLADLQTLRVRRNQGSARRDLIGRIFRHVHTIKGSASALDLDVATKVSHELESMLDEARMGRIAPDDALIEALDDGVAAIAASIHAARRGEAAVMPAALLDRIRRIATREGGGVQAGVAEQVLALLPEDVARSLSQYELVRLRESIDEGARLYIIHVTFALETFDERFRELSAELSGNGDLISTMPGVDPATLDQIGFRLVYSAKTTAEDLSRRLERYAELTLNELIPAAAEPSSPAEPGTDEAIEAEPDRLSTVRVDLRELDDAVAATHELATDAAIALEAALAADLPRRLRTDLELRAARIRRRFAALEEQLIELRMVSLDQTMSRIIRAGTTAARTSGKEVDFVKLGSDVLIDKSLADGIFEPLLHLIRNAVDHGIEMPQDRRTLGKPARGNIRVEAEPAGSRVRVRIVDDGRGIDPGTIRETALNRGLADAMTAMTDQQVLRLIFQPGFSTASSISELSGRGVGLDVVQSMVAHVGGELHLSSDVETGTTFELILPTTLAVISTLVVRSAGAPYCLAADHISEAGFVATDSIRPGTTGRQLTWRDQTLPYVALRDLLDQPPAPAAARQQLVIARLSQATGTSDEEGSPEALVAIGVDSWDGHREILVRGLGSHADHWWGISGATELPSGQVALVLDLPRLLSGNLMRTSAVASS
jgi:two-component system chemotaxis sensor kinase CheA